MYLCVCVVGGGVEIIKRFTKGYSQNLWVRGEKV